MKMKKEIVSMLLAAALMTSSLTACTNVEAAGNDIDNTTTESEKVKQIQPENLSFSNSNNNSLTVTLNNTKRFLPQEQCADLQNTALEMWINMDKTNPDSRALRKMLEALIPTECTLVEFGQIFSDYVVNYEEYAYDKKHHAIIVQIPSLPGLEFQFQCDPTTHTSQTHNNHFELIAITSDYPLLFPEYENLSVENLKENGEDISIEQGSLLIQIIIEKEFSYYNICDEIPTEGTPITPRGKVVLTPFYYPQKG